MKHQCPEMKRADDIKTPQGIAAYDLYSTWMKLLNRKAPSIETFSTSRYFNTFVKFVAHANKLRLPSKEQFMKLMAEKNISPMLWMKDECYSFYLEWLDRNSDPLDQAAATIDTLYKIADAADTSVTNVFNALHYREVMQLIRQRQLSPWLLLCSKQFKRFLVALEAAEKDELLNLIGYAYWAEKFDANPNVVEQMKLLATEMGI
jgi:hypothetical protein